MMQVSNPANAMQVAAALCGSYIGGSMNVRLMRGHVLSTSFQLTSSARRSLLPSHKPPA